MRVELEDLAGDYDYSSLAKTSPPSRRLYPCTASTMHLRDGATLECGFFSQTLVIGELGSGESNQLTGFENSPTLCGLVYP